MPQSQHNQDARIRRHKLANTGVGGAPPASTHHLRCGHETSKRAIIVSPGVDRRQDIYECPQGCGLHKRSR